MNYRDPKNSKGQVEKLARAYHRKYHAALGRSLSVEDLTQEFWITWHKVVRAYDPARGAAFSTVLWTSLRNTAIRLAQTHGRRSKIGCASLDDCYESNGALLTETLASDEPSALDLIIQRQTAQRALELVDPRLRILIEMIVQPSAIIQEEIAGLKAKAEFGRSIGAASHFEPRLTLPMMMKLFGLSRCAQYRLMDQAKELLSNDQ
jgi:DNA-directed RNA polymerase specialized sigma24 family protein